MLCEASTVAECLVLMLLLMLVIPPCHAMVPSAARWLLLQGWALRGGGVLLYHKVENWDKETCLRQWGGFVASS